LEATIIKPEDFVSNTTAFGLGVRGLTSGIDASALEALFWGLAGFDEGGLVCAVIKPIEVIANAALFFLGIGNVTAAELTTIGLTDLGGLAGFDEGGLVCAVIEPIEVIANAALFFLGVGDGAAAFYALGVVAFAAFIGLAALCLRPDKTTERIDLARLDISLIAALSTATTGV
jgi:fumarate reductase subunit D